MNSGGHVLAVCALLLEVYLICQCLGGREGGRDVEGGRVGRREGCREGGRDGGR